jgi:mannose-6-phosphate isomerase-like protein (cupin superfamily)
MRTQASARKTIGSKFMIEKKTFDGIDYKVVHEFEGWKIGFLRYSDRFSKFDRLERHLLTDEVFTLIDGEATIYTLEEETLVTTKMVKGKLYSVGKGTWHHVQVSKDALLLVVENSNTSRDNTEKRSVDHADQ